MPIGEFSLNIEVYNAVIVKIKFHILRTTSIIKLQQDIASKLGALFALVAETVSQMAVWSLAYGVSLQLACIFFNPWTELDFEIVGVILFIFLVTTFMFVGIRSKGKTVEMNTTN